MKTPSKFLAVGFLSLSLVLASGTAALASDPSDGFVSQAAKLSFENSTQDISGLNTPLPLDSDMAKKMAEALETINNVPGVSDDERSQITQELKTLKTKQPKAVAQVNSRMLSIAQRASTTPSLRALPVTHYAQINNSYCGPASAFMILKYKGKPKSADKKITLSQGNLATANYLNTKNAGSTPWASKRMATGLNKWLGKNTYGQVQSPSLAVMKGAFVRSINATTPVAVSTVEFANGAHYNKHTKSRLIGHWIVGTSYDKFGTNLGFRDPGTSVWKSASKTFGSSSSSFHKYVKTNGIAY